MKVGIYRVFYHTITERFDEESQKTVEVSHTSPEMVMIAAEEASQLHAALPAPQQKAGTTTRNVIVQIDQKHRNVLLAGGLK